MNRIASIATKLAFLTVVAAAAFLVPVTRAADNTATGDIAGVDADLNDSNTFTLNSTTLALIKRAFLASTGQALTSGTNVPKGTAVKFLIYVNNSTNVAVNDMSVKDILAANFVYQPGTIKVDNNATCAGANCTGPEEDAIFAAVDATAAKTDAVDGPDVVSYTAGTKTIDAGNASVAGNGQVNAAASKVWAMSFTVVMQ